MSLSVIVGPPNSGRAGELRARLVAALARDPILVVPTADDAARFERELCDSGGAVLGASIHTFRRLAAEIGAAVRAPSRPSLSAAQRLALVRAAVRATELRILARSAARHGFAAALERLIGELQAARVEPEELAAAAAELDDGRYEAEIAALYAGYLERRDAAGLDDDHAAVAAVAHALRERPSAWGRPVMLYGFDDLTEEQLDLVSALSVACELTVAVNYADREALAARAGLLARLRDELGAGEVMELPFDEGYTNSATLRHLDQHLFEPGAPRVEPDGGLALLQCGGALGEAEAVGGEIARLLASGARPDDVLVVLRGPDRTGPLFERVLRRLGVPIAVEASIPLSRTAVGHGLAALARAAAPGGDGEELLTFLRARPGPGQGMADWVERRLRRGEAQSADELLESWRSPPRLLAALRAAPGGAGWLRALAAAARALAEEPYLGREPGSGEAAAGADTPFEPLELRAAAVAAATLDELAELARMPGCVAPSPAEALAALDETRVAMWRGPTEGRVRVLSPYRARAARARHLFACSLQDGEFPGGGGNDPLLGDERRNRLGLPALSRQETVIEERYLFHACASRPTERLWLSWRSSDEEGRPATRSAFVDDVLDLLAPDPETAEERLVDVRGLERVVFGPADAPTPRELARARAALGPRVPEALPGPLAQPAVLAELAARDPVGAGTLEKWIECPYRWFTDHELAPQRLEPEPDYLIAGSVVHATLERVYREAPGEDSIPRPADLESWRRRALELIDEEAHGRGLAPERPAARVVIARMRAQVERLLEREARSETDLRPLLLEASFGEGEECARPELDLGGVRIHGQIDRVDATPDERSGLVYDYKTGARTWPAAKLAEEGKLQLQLYGAALRDRWGIEPLGGLYHPLGRRPDARPRGFVVRGVEACDSLDLSRTDRLEPDEVAETLEAGARTAREKAAAMRAGAIGRDPNGGSCPPWCSYQPICRLERAIGIEDSGEARNGAG